MCVTTFAALFGLATGCVAGAPSNLLAPLDPRQETRWHPPPSPLAGLKRYVPVEASADWGSNFPPASPSKGGGPMPGMSMPGMKGMGAGGMDMEGKP